METEVENRFGLLALALSISAAVHLALFWVPINLTSGPKKLNKRVIAVKIRALKAEEKKPAVDPSVPEENNGKQRISQDVVKVKPRSKESLKDPVQKAPLIAPEVKGSLNLSLPVKDTRDLHFPQGGLTANGAVVMDGELLKKLNAGRAKTASETLSTASAGGPAFSGGSWSYDFKIDGKCFRVIEANPLDSSSLETWVRVACR